MAGGAAVPRSGAVLICYYGTVARLESQPGARCRYQTLARLASALGENPMAMAAKQP